MNKGKYIITFLFLIFVLQNKAQDLEKIGKKDMITVGGGLNFSSVFYNANGIPNRRQPFTYFLNGNLTANFLGITMPYTFNYSNNQITYNQPYNIQSFNPTYKWIKGYAGITSMNFSQYTQSNHIFAGGGVELTPKNFKFAALYGRFKKTTLYELETNSDSNMAYKRIGWGGYAGYNFKGSEIKVIYFSAQDDPTSLAFVPITTSITPMRNTVISAVGKTTLFKKVNIEAEYALSGITRNIQSVIDIETAPKNKLPIIFITNPTSQFFQAYKGSVGYRIKMINLAFNYERVEPEYQTLGSYFFNNDLENFTFAPSATLLKGKLNLSANTGLQKNNLNDNKLSTTKRWVGSMNAAYMPSQKWIFNLSYSNFSSFTRQRPQDNPFYRDNLDTLNFYQLTQSGNGSISHNFGNATLKHAQVLNTSYQVTGQKQGAIADATAFGINQNINSPAKVINASFSHNFQFIKSKTSLCFNFNSNYSEQGPFYTLFIGPGVVFGKSIVKNLVKLSSGITYNKIYLNGTNNNNVINARLSANYNPKLKNPKIGKIAFTSSVIYTQKLKSQAVSNLFNEFTGNLGINYNF